MFYDYKATFQARKIVTNEIGEEEIGALEDVLTVECDLQPYSSEKLQLQYGMSEKVTNIIFCEPLQEIRKATDVLINNESYVIKSVIPWEQQFEVMICRQ